MSKVRHQLLITLVHGTWGRGFFPRRQVQNRCPLWFEEGSPFLARLSTELGDIPHKIRPLLWSGENSVFVRDKTAHALAEHLSAEHAQHPQATQLIIAHSHGGNIALRALHHLRKASFPLSSTEIAKPLIITLATPFLEIHQVNFGYSQNAMRFLPVFVIFYLINLFSVLAKNYFIRYLGEDYFGAVAFFSFFGTQLTMMGLIFWWWMYRMIPALQSKLDDMKDATRFGAVPGQRLLIIRAIDDEASLTLAFGALLSYLMTRVILYLPWLLLPAMLLPSLGYIGYQMLVGGGPNEFTIKLGLGNLSVSVSAIEINDWNNWLNFAIFVMALIGTLPAWRFVFGRELTFSSAECQVNTQSAPDAVGLSEIVTLVSNRYIRGLRHKIYAHENCAKAISDWVHQQLCVERRP